MRLNLPATRTALAIELELAFRRYCDALLQMQPQSNRNTFDMVCSFAVDVCKTAMVTRARQLNASLDINRIPQEILSMIFEYLPVASRWTAAITCSHWRGVSLANSRLWTEVICEVDKSGSKPCLQTAARRAGARPMAISVRFSVDTTQLQLSRFCATLPSWAPRVVLLKIALQLHPGSGADSCCSEESDTRERARASRPKASGVADHLARLLSVRISSTSFTQLEALVLQNIPLRLHSGHLTSLRRLSCMAGVVLMDEAALKQLVMIRTNQLTFWRKEALAAAFAQPIDLQQLYLARGMSILSAALQYGQDPPPLMNLRYVQWPALRLLDPVASEHIILAYANRSWTHYVPWDGEIRMRLAYVAPRLPRDSVVELHYGRGPSSACSFLRIITVAGAQWFFPRSLRDEAPATLTNQSLGRALTSVTVFSIMHCSRRLVMPHLRTLGILIAARNDMAPITIMHGPGKLWKVPKLEVLRIEREANSDRGVVRAVGRSAGDAQVPFRAFWADSRVTISSKEVARFVRENVQHGNELTTLVLHAVSLEDPGNIPAPMIEVEWKDMETDVDFKVPYIYADNQEATNMYAAVARPVKDRT